jgi:hypothetical protein
MNAVQLSQPKPCFDRPVADAKRCELAPSDDAVLPLGKVRQASFATLALASRLRAAQTRLRVRFGSHCDPKLTRK